MFWGASRRKHLGSKNSELAEIAIEIMRGERSPDSIYSSFSTPQSTFNTPGTTNSSLPDSDYPPSIFSRSSSRTSYTSLNSKKDTEIRDLWELGRLKEERQKLLDPLQRRVVASKEDATSGQNALIPDVHLVEEDEDILEVAVLAAHVPRYSQKFKQLKQILSPRHIPGPIDMTKIKEGAKKPDVIVDEAEDEYENPTCSNDDCDSELDQQINDIKLDWLKEAYITSVAEEFESGDQAMYGVYDRVPEDVCSGVVYRGVRVPAYSQVTSIDYTWTK